MDILREFLVALGFKVDAAGLKRFTTGVAQATKVAAGLVSGADAAATAVTAMVTKVSAKFEDLYYASQRIGSSVENIRAFEFAVGQMGGTAEGARAALESMGEFFRSNPGAERFIAGLGIQTRDANGQLRDMTGIMSDLAKKLRSMPYYRAKVIAGVLGIDPRTLQAMLRGTDEASDKFHQMAKRAGVDMDAAAKASHDFMNDVRELVQMLIIAGDRILIAIQPTIEKVVHWLEQADQSTDGWSTALIALIAILGPLLALLGPVAVAIIAVIAGLAALWADLQKWKSGGDSVINWGPWADSIDEVVAAGKDLWAELQRLWAIVAPVVVPALRVMGAVLGDVAHTAIREVINILHILADTLRLISDLLQGKWSAAWKDAKAVVKDMIKSMTDLLDMGIKAIRRFWYSATHRGAQMPEEQAAPTGATAQERTAAIAAQATRQAHGVARGVSGHALAFFQQQGWGAPQSAGIVANLQTESRLDPNAVGDNGAAYGIGQWHADRQAAFKQWAGKDIHGSTLAEQLAFVHFELTRGMERFAGRKLLEATSARDAGAAVSRFYERPKDTYGAMAARGELAEQLFRSQASRTQTTSVSVSQETNIHITGGGADETGRRVVAAQDRVNGNLVRNLKGAAS